MKHYLLKQKSHSKAPDFEMELDAKDKTEAISKFWESLSNKQKAGFYDKEGLAKFVGAIKPYRKVGTRPTLVNELTCERMLVSIANNLRQAREQRTYIALEEIAEAIKEGLRDETKLLKKLL